MHLYDGGVPLPYIRDILGHVDLSTTEIYARASTEAKRKALEAVYADVVTADSWPNGTKTPNCSTGSPASDRVRDYAQRSVVTTAPTRGNRRTLRITQRCS